MNEFIQNFEEAIDGVEPGQVNAETKFRELDCWDSLSLLSLLAMVDINYSKQLNVEDLKSCNTIQDLYNKVSG